jgi:hypothetical protein
MLPYELRGIGVTAAALVCAFGIGFALRGGGAEAALTHSCSATDKRFIQDAGTDMTALSIWSEGYRTGEIAAEDVVQQAEDAAKRVGYAKPRDPSLQLSQRLIDEMFREYGRAVALAAKERQEAGRHMHRAYGLANFARDVLLQAQPELEKHGCDVGPLL